jgi:hypothetical protein
MYINAKINESAVKYKPTNDATTSDAVCNNTNNQRKSAQLVLLSNICV